MSEDALVAAPVEELVPNKGSDHSQARSRGGVSFGGRWLLLCVVLFSVTLIGCSGSSDDSVVEITLWHQMMSGERALLADELKRFENAYPNQVRVKPVYKETEQLRSGFESAAMAGIGPELIFGPNDTVQIYQTMGILQDMRPWMDDGALGKFTETALTFLPKPDDPDQQELLQIGDRVGNHLALVYNTDFIEEPPPDYETFAQLARDNTIRDAKGNAERYGLVWNYIEPYFVVPFLTANGAWVFREDDPHAPNLNTPESIAAFEMILHLRDVDRVVPENCNYELADALFKDGKAAMIINGDWSWNEYLTHPKINAAIAPLPVYKKTGLPLGPMVATKGYSLNANATGESADWAMKLVKFLTDKDTQRRMALAMKTVPSCRELLNDPELAADPELAVSIEQMRRGRGMPIVPEMRAVWDAMRPHYQALLGGSEVPDAAAAKMQQEAEQKIEMMNRDDRGGTMAAVLRWTGWALLIALCMSQWGNFREFCHDFPRNQLAYWFVLPAFLVIFATVVFPFLFNVVLSFSNMSMKHLRDWEVVGFQSYVEVFQDPKFWPVLAKTIVWTVVNVFFHVVIGLMLAVALNGPIRGKRLYRILLIIPWAVPAYITALTWQGMFDLKYGAINLWLGQLGIAEVNWLGHPFWMFIACLVTNIWLGFPFMMIVALGGMQAIPQELYEAASLDRASRWRQFWDITLPMLKPVMLPAITLGVIWTFNKLDVIWLVSDGGRPNDQTHIMVSYVYRAVFNLYRYGYGAALSMIIFGMLLLFSWAFLRKTEAAESVT